jgi:hypothetical protein
VSTAGGGEALWSRSGNEIYYVSPDGKLMAVKVTTSPAFELGKPVALLDAKPYYFGGLGRNYDVARDGRFVMIKNGPSSSTTTTVTVTLNWLDEIRGKLKKP